MMVFTMPCWKSALKGLCAAGLLLLAVAAPAGSIEPSQAALHPTDEGWSLSAEFNVDLGARIEEAIGRGVPVHFILEFDLKRARWYWSDEHVAGRKLEYKLAYNALVRQYRLSAGGLHQNFSSLEEVMRVISRVGSLRVIERGEVIPGETYNAALRLMLDSSQLPKPLQVDALANRDWKIDSKVLRWQFIVPVDGR